MDGEIKIIVWPPKITIELIISVLALLLSLALAVHQLYFERKQLKVRIAKYFRNCENVHFLMVFENRSRLPISVTKITLCVGDGIDCEYLPKWIGSERETLFGGKSEARIDFYTLQVPISLHGLGAQSGYILFDGPLPDLPVGAKSVTFRVHTSRGRARKIELELPTGDTFHLRDTVVNTRNN